MRQLLRGVSLVITCVIMVSFIGTDWELVNSEGDIKVYNREVAGYDIPQSKVEVTTVGGSIAKAKKVMLNFAGYKDWIPSCASSKLIKNKGGGKYIYYATYDAPWPVSDRDIYIEVSLVETPTKIVLKNVALPKYKPEKEGYVRIPMSKSEWVFEKKSTGLYMKNVALSSPGGSIPDWLAATASEDIPLELMQNMVPLVK